MSTLGSGQSGQEPPIEGLPPGRSGAWPDPPEDELREWLKGLVIKYRLRGVVVLLGGHPTKETVRLFIRQEVESEQRTLDALKLLYRKLNPRDYVAQDKPEYGTPERIGYLKEILPEGESEAREFIEFVIERREPIPDELLPKVQKLQKWLERLLAAEYYTEELIRKKIEADRERKQSKPAAKPKGRKKRKKDTNEE